MLGGGSIGCDQAQAMARLDVDRDVTLVDAADRLLPREEAGVAATAHRALDTGGVNLRGGSSVEVVLPSGPRADTLRLDDESEVEFDRRPGDPATGQQKALRPRIVWQSRAAPRMVESLSYRQVGSSVAADWAI